MANKDFAAFILTHGRPDSVITYNAMRKANYTGKIYLIVDDEDKQLPKYISNFGEESVRVFNKNKIALESDSGNNFGERRTILYARNACFKIAKELGIIYFLQLDDDYKDFRHRFLSKCGTILKSVLIDNMDLIIDLHLNFYKKTPFKSIAFAQGGDFLGGAGNDIVTKDWPLKRKCMNSFFCSVNREFQFVGALNDDVNTYVTLGNRGELFGTIPMVCLTQKQTQKQKGGLTDMYLRFGTYCKSFTTTIMHPSGVRVSMLNSEHQRLHHLIDWNKTAPKIIDEKYKKKENV